MPSTASSILALELQANGENDGTWNDKYNTVFQMLEGALSGTTSITVADSGVTSVSLTNFTKGTFHNVGFTLTGTLTAARTVEFPAKPKLFAVYNNTTGGFAVNVRISGSASISVRNGALAILWSTGTAILAPVNDALNGSASLALDAAAIATGTMAIARLPVAGSGTVSSTSVVRADDTRLSDTRTPTDLSVTFAKLAAATLASQAEAEAGTATNKLPTPERVKQYVDVATGMTRFKTHSVAIPSSAGSTGAAHNLGAQPKFSTCVLRCISADRNYSVGDTFPLEAMRDVTSSTHARLYVMFSTSVYYVVRTTNDSIFIFDYSTHVAGAIDTAKWVVDMYLWA